MWSATKTRQYHPESRTRVPFRRGAIRGHYTVAPPITVPVDQSEPSSRHATQRCINVRHAAGHSPDAITCGDTRVAADQNRSPAMFAIAGLRGNGIWISTKEPCSAEDHLNPSRHRNGAGLLLMKTHFPNHRSNSWMTNSRATYKMPFVTTGGVYAHMWPKDPCRRGITTG